MRVCLTPKIEIRKSRPRGLTLIELLVVVIIVAVLAAAAVPNLLEARTRAKVARVHSDLRALSMAAEAYAVDNNDYPSTRSAFFPLMQPIPYIADVFMEDPFDPPYAYFLINLSPGDEFADEIVQAAFADDYEARERIYSQRYLFTSAGPDKIYLIELIDGVPLDEVNDDDFIPWLQALRNDEGAVYDPTNGTVSPGDIGRSTKGITLPTLVN